MGDFDVGEIGSGPRSTSPLIDVEAVSDDESDIHNSTVGQCNDDAYLCCLSVLFHCFIVSYYL